MQESLGQLAGADPVRSFAERIQNDGALRKLNEISQNLSGLFLVILVRVANQMVELYSAGGEGEFPHFCQVYRGSAEGEMRCRTCRSQVAFSACYRGLIEFACHGGVSVIAAPVTRRDGTRSDRIVVASCSFAQQSHERGWSLVRKHANHQGMDIKELKRAYFELPTVSEERRNLARGITEAAASLLGTYEEQFACDPDGASTARIGQDLDSCWPGFGLTRDPSYKPQGGSVGSILVDQVIALVRRDPSLPYSVSSIARSAHVTPNHFSTLFSKHTGQTFRTFLSEQRCLLARELLRDIRVPVSEVAHRVGFRDSAYFSRRFKAVIGSSPTEWRVRNLEPREPALPPLDARQFAEGGLSALGAAFPCGELSGIPEHLAPHCAMEGDGAKENPWTPSL